MVLAKSSVLNKSALDMIHHYLELLTFIHELQQNPEIILDDNYKVFHSEKRLYGNDITINHRLHKRLEPVHARLLALNEWDESLLYPLAVSGAAAMEMKLY